MNNRVLVKKCKRLAREHGLPVLLIATQLYAWMLYFELSPY